MALARTESMVKKYLLVLYCAGWIFILWKQPSILQGTLRVTIIQGAPVGGLDGHLRGAKTLKLSEEQDKAWLKKQVAHMWIDVTFIKFLRASTKILANTNPYQH